MTLDKKVAYWIDLSEYDLDTARSMLESKRFLYVGFMCHQAIEKILKAFWQFKFSEIPPRTHNLAYLGSKIGILELLPEAYLDFLDELEPLNIQSRYPEYKDFINERFDQKYADSLVGQSMEVHQWIKQKLLQQLENI
jgi:HEPN domain-containing protein